MKCEIERKTDRKNGDSNFVELVVKIYDYDEGSTLKLGIAEIKQPIDIE